MHPATTQQPSNISPNCKPDEHPTTLFTYFGTHHTKNPADNSPLNTTPHSMWSCQSSDAAPDSKTYEHMRTTFGQTVGESDPEKISVIAHAMPLKSTSLEAHATRLLTQKMASNCGDSARLQDVTSHNRYVCHYLGKGRDTEGNTVENPHQKWSGTLASCEKSIDVSEQTAHDIKVMAYHQAKGKEAGLDVHKFSCQVSAIPSL